MLRALELASRHGARNGADAHGVSEVRVTGPAGEVRMTVGIGVAPDDGHGPDHVVRRADAALYEAKRGGLDRGVFGSARRSGDRKPG